MSIYDIQISKITNQYLEYVKAIQDQDIELAQEFMVLAAELIKIKSRMLLPIEQNTADGEEAPEDPRTELVQKILEYKTFKEMAAFLEEQADVTSHIHEKPAEDFEKFSGEPEEIIKGSMDEFANAFMQFIHKKQRLEEIHKVYERIERQKLSMERRIHEVVEALNARDSMKFSELIEGDTTNFNRVVTFMSVLALLKERSIKAEQKERFGDITLTKANPNEEIKEVAIND